MSKFTWFYIGIRKMIPDPEIPNSCSNGSVNPASFDTHTVHIVKNCSSLSGIVNCQEIPRKNSCPISIFYLLYHFFFLTGTFSYPHPRTDMTYYEKKKFGPHIGPSRQIGKKVNWPSLSSNRPRDLMFSVLCFYLKWCRTPPSTLQNFKKMTHPTLQCRCFNKQLTCETWCRCPGQSRRAWPA
jgi:hypothetical protein